MKSRLLICSVLMALALNGCMAANYSVKKYDATTGNLVSSFDAQSRRELENLDVEYQRETGTFTAHVGKATSQASPVESAVADLLPYLLKLAEPASDEK